MDTKVDIKVSYRSIDRFSQTRRFKTLAGAQKYAQKMLGETPDLGGWYAVSQSGVGRVTVDGCALTDLFPRCAESQDA